MVAVVGQQAGWFVPVGATGPPRRQVSGRKSVV